MALPSADLRNTSVNDSINNYVFTDLVAERTLTGYENMLSIARHFRRDESTLYNGTRGETVDIQRPLSFIVKDGRVADPQRIEEGTWPISIDRQKNVAVNLTSRQKTMFFPEFASSVVDPATMALANYTDKQAAGMYKSAYHYIDFTSRTADSTSGTPAGVPNKRIDAANAVNVLCKLGVSKMGMMGFVTLDTLNALSSFVTTLDNPDMIKGAYSQFYESYRIAGIEWVETQSIARHTVGAWGTGPLAVNGGSQYHVLAAGSSSNDLDTQTLAIDGFTASTNNVLNEGDIIKITGVKKVNLVPEENTNKTVLTDDMSFTVTSTGNNSNSDGECSVTIRPAMVIEGPYQNVSAAPNDDAVVTVVGTAGSSRYENLLFKRDAFALPMRMLATIGDGGGGIRSSRRQENGLGIRVNWYADGRNDTEEVRFDVLFGLSHLDGNNCVRILTSK